jgi:hypothetical protein
MAVNRTTFLEGAARSAAPETGKTNTSEKVTNALAAKEKNLFCISAPS